MTELSPCPSCRRHVAVDESVCPFCAAALPGRSAPEAAPGPRGRLSRAALFAASAAMMGTVACSDTATGGGGPDAGAQGGSAGAHGETGGAGGGQGATGGQSGAGGQGGKGATAGGGTGGGVVALYGAPPIQTGTGGPVPIYGAAPAPLGKDEG